MIYNESCKIKKFSIPKIYSYLKKCIIVNILLFASSFDNIQTIKIYIKVSVRYNIWK